MKKSNVLKFSGQKESDNIETIPGLNDTLKEWLETLSMPFESHSTTIENFEFQSRSGFIAHRHNCGGLDLMALSDVASLMGSGEHFGTVIEQWTEKAWDYNREYVAKENPTVDAESDEFYDLTYSASSGDYDAIAWRVRVMYEGNGVLRIYTMFDKDAPYFRFDSDCQLETEIRFKTISGLERQLKALTKKVEDSQNESKITKKTA